MGLTITRKDGEPFEVLRETISILVPECAVAGSVIGLYERTRKEGERLLSAYAFERQEDLDPDYAAHRANLRDMIALCERASDALVVDYGG